MRLTCIPHLHSLAGAAYIYQEKWRRQHEGIIIIRQLGYLRCFPSSGPESETFLSTSSDSDEMWPRLQVDCLFKLRNTFPGLHRDRRIKEEKPSEILLRLLTVFMSHNPYPTVFLFTLCLMSSFFATGSVILSSDNYDVTIFLWGTMSTTRSFIRFL